MVIILGIVLIGSSCQDPQPVAIGDKTENFDRYMKVDSLFQVRPDSLMYNYEPENAFVEAYVSVKFLERQDRKDPVMFDSMVEHVSIRFRHELENDDFLKAQYHEIRARKYQEVFDHEEATKWFRKARNLYESAGRKAKMRSLEMLSNIAITHQYYGGHVDTAAHYARSLQDSIALYPDYPWKYNNLYCLADIYRRTGNLELAKHWAVQAREELYKLNPVNYRLLAESEVLIANIELARKDYKSALKSYNKGIDLARDIDSCSSDLLYYYNNYLALLLREKNVMESEFILSEFNSIPGSDNANWRFIEKKHRGHLHYINGAYEKAISEYSECLKIGGEIDLNNEDYSDAYELSGACLLKMGQIDRAYYHFKEARHLLSGKNKESVLRYKYYPRALVIDILIGHCEILMGIDSGNEDLIESGLHKLNSIEENLLWISIMYDPVTANIAQDNFSFVYDALLDYQIKIGKDAKRIFELIEYKKNGYDSWSGDFLNCIQSDILNKIVKLDREIRKAYQNSYRTAGVKEHSLLNMHRLIKSRDVYFEEFFANDHYQVELMRNCIGRRYHEIIEGISEYDEKLILNIYYHDHILAFDRLLIGIYDGRDFRYSHRALTEEIKSKIEMARSLVVQNADPTALEEIKTMLFNEIDLENGSSQNLIILNDGPFYDIPTGSLPLGDGSSSIDQSMNVSYAYSLLDLNFDSAAFDATADINVLAYSDVSSILNIDEAELKELPGTYLEAGCIREHYNGQVHVLSGHEVQWKNIKASQPQINILHIGLHGVFDEANRLNNKLFIRNDNGVVTRPVFISDLIELDLRARLLVLSSCHSTSGQKFRSLGTVSFARELSKIIGSSSISYLWQLDDIEAADFMCIFYERLKINEDPIISLREAKVEYLKKTGNTRVTNGLVFYH